MRLVTLPLVVLLALVSWASGQITEGQWTYVIENGGASITGSTATGDVTIPSELDGYAVKKVGVGSNIFGNFNFTVTSVSIPDSVTSIGDAAFSYCPGLTSVSIGNGVTSIGSSAFYECSRLTSVSIGNGVMSIGQGAFYGCSGLTSVSIPDSVTSIGYAAFSYCSGLTSVSIGNGVTGIGASAFEKCVGLTSVTIPDSVTSIGDKAFAGCTGLTSVGIGSGVTSIGVYAFAFCTGLTSVIIPDSVTSIGDAAFSYCSGLTNIYFRGDRPVVENTIFAEIQPVGIVYYLIGSNGWGSTYAGWPTQPYSLAPTLTPVISSWPSASPITYGQALSNSVLSGGSADVDGSFAWTTPTNVPPVGTNSYSVTFSPVNADTYQTVSTNVPVVVSRYYTQDEYDSFGAQQFSNGQRSVTTNPAAFSLYTESQFAANRITGVAEGKAEVIEVPESYGLYDSTSIMDLRMGGLMIQKQGTDATIVFQPQTTTDLVTLPFTNNGPPITNAIPMPGDKGFLRVGAIYVPAGDLTDVLNNVDVGDTFTY